MSKHFTIVINACEQQDWITKCIESCVTQDYDNYEVIMVDALSTDKTYEIAKEFESNYENFKVFQNGIRVPQIANILFLTKQSKDKSIIVTVDGDDYLKNDQVLNKLNDIYTDDIWMTYGNFETFQVIDTVVIEDQTWIHYKRIKDSLEFSCLEESFIHRFSRDVSNERY